MLPYSQAFEERLLRPDSPIRPIVVAQTVDKNTDGTLRAAIRQRRDDWGLADGAAAGPPPTLAGFDLLENGDVRLHDTVTTVVTKAGPPNAYFTNLSRGFPVTAPLVLWNGADRSDLELKRVKIWLNPRVSGAQTRQVARWKLEAYALVQFQGGGSVPSTPSLWIMTKIADALPVDVTNDAEGLVTFDFSAGAIVHRPKPKLHNGGFSGIDPTPRTLFHVVALDAFGNNASNVGLGYDSGVNSVASAGNVLSTYQLTQNTPYTGTTFSGIGVDGGAVAGCPIMTIESGTYAASATLSFTANPLNLGGAPAGDVQLIGRAHVPNGCAVTYQVRNDADSAWITYTDGQFMTADLGLVPTPSRKFQTILASDASLTATPTLTGIGMESLSETIFMRQTKVTGGNWAIDPHTMKGEIPEVLISFLRDGDKDYSSAIEDLLANNHIGDIRIRLFWGDEGLARKDWLHDDDFLIDGSHPRGPEVRLKCLSVLCLLRDLVPRFKIGGVYPPASDVSVAGWTTETGAAVNLYASINEATFNDTTFIKSSLTPVNEGVEFLLPTITDPAGRRHLVDYRYRKDVSSGEQIDLTVQLRQGVGTIIASQAHANIDTDAALSATPFTFSLTDAQIALITNYADLRIRFIANKSSGAGARRAVVSWCVPRTGGKQDQVAYSGTLKAAYDGLFNNELGIDARHRGNGVEDVLSQNQVAKTIFQASGASNKPLGKSELDAIAFIAGCGITSEQGKIVAPNMFNVEPVRFLFPSSEISLDEAGPGYEERMPQLFATWKWNAAKGDFDRQEYVAHAGALLHLGKARLDPAQWFDVEMAKWLSSEGLDANGVSLAGRVGVRQVQALGPGLMLWPFVTNYRFPMLRPGDVIALQTDKFVARDPNVARAIRGALWVTAMIQSRDASARRFIAWVRNYSDLIPTAATGDRNGLGPATPHVMAVKATIDESGAAHAIITTNAAGALRYAASTAGMPSDATVRAATLQVVDSAGYYYTDTVLNATPGQTVYWKAFAYEKADGSGLESAASTATVKMGTRKRNFVFDDGKFPLVSSTADGLTADAPVVDSTGSEIRKSFHKVAHTDPDTANSVPDGTAKRVVTLDEGIAVSELGLQLAQAESIMMNGDFERGMRYWRRDPASTAGDTVTIETGASKYSGARSIKLHQNGSGDLYADQVDRLGDDSDSAAGNLVYIPADGSGRGWEVHGRAIAMKGSALQTGTLFIEVKQYDASQALISTLTVASLSLATSYGEFAGGVALGSTTRFITMRLHLNGPSGTVDCYADDVKAWLVMPKLRCKVYNSAAQSIANNTDTQLTWDSEDHDIGSLHAPGSGQLKPPALIGPGFGLFLLVAQVEWAAGVTGYRQVRILWNDGSGGQTQIAKATCGPTPTIETTQIVTAYISRFAYDSAVPDFFEVYVKHTQGAALNVNGGVRVSEFSLIQLW